MNQAEHGGDDMDHARRRASRSRRLLATTALLVAMGAAGLADGHAEAEQLDSHTDDTAYVMSDVHCSRGGDGVLDLTLVNDSAAASAEFVVAGHDAVRSAAFTVAPSSAHALAFTGLSDGDVDVPVRIDGEGSTVHAVVDCDLPRLTDRLSSAAVAGSAPVDTPELPRTGTDVGGFLVGGLLVSAGIAASLLARRRYG